MKIPYSIKKQNIIISAFIILVTAIVTAVCTALALAFTEKKVTFITQEIEITYGETPDLSEFAIIVENAYGNQTKHLVSEDNIKYEHEQIGTQSAEVIYKKKRQTFQLTILPKQLDTPQIKITNGINATGNETKYVEWDSISGADSYKVYINGSPFDAEEGARYDLSQFPQNGTLEIQVLAKGDNPYRDSELSQICTLTKLETISNLRYTDGAFIWDKVETALGYKVTVNGETSTVSENCYPFDNFKVGENVFSVYAFGDDGQWDGNNVSLKLKKLAAAENVTYDWSTGKISWEYGSVDVLFKVYVNDKLVDETYNRFTQYQFVPSQIYKVEITANGENVIASDTCSKVLSVTKLDAPILNLANETLSWSEAQGAQFYEISIDNVIKTQNENSISISSLSAGKHEVAVRSFSAGGLYMSSDYTVYTFTKLADVINLVYDRPSSKFSWTKIADALKYEIAVNGIRYQTQENSYVYEGNFKEGANQITVTAVTKSANDVAGAPASLTLYKLQKVRNVSLLGGSLSWEDDNTDCRYKIEVENEVFTTANKQIPLMLERLAIIRITAYSDSSAIIDSDIFEESFTAMTLQEPSVKVTRNYRWEEKVYDIKITTPVEHATTYEATVYFYLFNAEGEEKVEEKSFTLGNDTTGLVMPYLYESDGFVAYSLRVEVVAIDEEGNYNNSPVSVTEIQIK